jgi:hypothetical protein
MQVPTNFSYMPTGDKPSLSLFANAVLRVWQLMCQVVNGGISFGNGSSFDNISGIWSTVTFAVANADQTITHNLGRIPVGYIVMTKNQAGDVYTGSVAATSTQITLRCTTTATVSLFII